jgi:hypothetical protein
MPPHIREALGRDPSENPTPFDRGSFYVEDLKYGPGPAKFVGVQSEQLVAELEALLRDAGVQTMTGAELMDALEFYARSMALAFHVPLLVSRSLFLDGVMHGIAFAAGLDADLSHRRGEGGQDA